jgi:hypothetical protein
MLHYVAQYEPIAHSNPAASMIADLSSLEKRMETTTRK